MLEAIKAIWLLSLLLLDTAPPDPAPDEDEEEDDEGDPPPKRPRQRLSPPRSEEEPAPDPDDGDPPPEETPEEEIRNANSRIRALEEEKDRHAKNAIKARKERDAAIAELDELKASGTSEALRDARTELAFYRELVARNEPIDIETAWDLGNMRGFFDALKIADDGNVEGMPEALDKIIDRYPYLVDSVDDSPSNGDKPLTRTAPPPHRRKDTGAASQSKAGLQQRFPALRNTKKAR